MDCKKLSDQITKLREARNVFESALTTANETGSGRKACVKSLEYASQLEDGLFREYSADFREHNEDLFPGSIEEKIEGLEAGDMPTSSECILTLPDGHVLFTANNQGVWEYQPQADSEYSIHKIIEFGKSGEDDQQAALYPIALPNGEVLIPIVSPNGDGTISTSNAILSRQDDGSYECSRRVELKNELVDMDSPMILTATITTKGALLACVIENASLVETDISKVPMHLVECQVEADGNIALKNLLETFRDKNGNLAEPTGFVNLQNGDCLIQCNCYPEGSALSYSSLFRFSQQEDGSYKSEGVLWEPDASTRIVDLTTTQSNDILFSCNDGTLHHYLHESDGSYRQISSIEYSAPYIRKTAKLPNGNFLAAIESSNGLRFSEMSEQPDGRYGFEQDSIDDLRLYDTITDMKPLSNGDILILTRDSLYLYSINTDGKHKITKVPRGDIPDGAMLYGVVAVPGGALVNTDTSVWHYRSNPSPSRIKSALNEIIAKKQNSNQQSGTN